MLRLTGEVSNNFDRCEMKASSETLQIVSSIYRLKWHVHSISRHSHSPSSDPSLLCTS